MSARLQNIFFCQILAVTSCHLSVHYYWIWVTCITQYFSFAKTEIQLETNLTYPRNIPDLSPERWSWLHVHTNKRRQHSHWHERCELKSHLRKKYSLFYFLKGMRKIRLVKTNQSPTGLAAVLEAGGTWGQVSSNQFFSKHLSFRAILIYHSCHSPCLTHSIIIQSDPVQSSQMFSALTPSKRCSILFIRLHKSKSRVTDVQINQMFSV